MLGKKPHPIKGGAPIPRDIPWKDIEHTKALHPIFSGTSLCGFIFCISQMPENSGETWCTLKFAKSAGAVRANVIKPTPYSLKTGIKETEALLKDAEKKMANMNDNQKSNK